LACGDPAPEAVASGAAGRGDAEAVVIGFAGGAAAALSIVADCVVVETAGAAIFATGFVDAAAEEPSTPAVLAGAGAGGAVMFAAGFAGGTAEEASGLAAPLGPTLPSGFTERLATRRGAPKFAASTLTWGASAGDAALSDGAATAGAGAGAGLAAAALAGTLALPVPPGPTLPSGLTARLATVRGEPKREVNISARAGLGAIAPPVAGAGRSGAAPRAMGDG
jgi:hypothetical protein